MSDTGATGGSVGKKSFNNIYDQPDPTGYFSTLKPLRYMAPHHGQPVFRAAARALRRIRGSEPVEMLDLCTGYGINGALINHQLSMDDLYRHYKASDSPEPDLAARLAKDKAYFRKHRLPQPVARVTGVDVAGNALHYAREVGILDEAVNINLESAPIADEHVPRFAKADMITVTGGFSYIGARTMMRLLSIFPEDRMPWILAFPLRHTDFTNCEAAFERFGLQVEQWDRWAFPHRNFADDGERAAVREAHDPERDAIEVPLSDRHFEATLYVARPEADVARCALSELVLSNNAGTRPRATADDRDRAAADARE